MQMCETTNRNRIVKAEGVEASWHMTAKPTGSTPTVNAAFVHRKFAFLPGGWTAYFGISQYYRPVPELDEWIRRRIRMCYWMTTIPGLVPPGYQEPSAAASCPPRVEETGSNVVHEYSAACGNTYRDGAEVSRGHSSVSVLLESGRPRRAEHVKQGGAMGDSILDDQARPG